MDFRCIKVHNDFLIAGGGVLFWVFCLLGFFFLVDHAVLLIYLMFLELSKAALGWFYSPLALSLYSHLVKRGK